MSAMPRLSEPAPAPQAQGADVARTAASVLVVDDDDTIRDVVGRYLERAGFEAIEAADGAEAQRRIAERSPDLLVLDVMIPAVDGLELCRWVRAHGPNLDVAIILLTARGEESDRIIGLELGADDYVVKPFSPRELVERVKAILRRTARDQCELPPRHLEMAGLTIDAEAREVHRDGVLVALTALEFDLLWCLASNPRVAFSREQLMARVWGYNSALDAGTATVTVHVRRLREKIELSPSDPRLITTVWGVGYRCDPW